jgi:hypothetical protein
MSMSKAARRRAKKSTPAKARPSTSPLSTSRQLSPGSLVTRIASGTLASTRRRDQRLLLVLSVVRASHCLPQYLCQYCDTQERRYFLPHQIARYDEELQPNRQQ